MTGIGKQMDSDIQAIKKLLGKGKGKKSYKEAYQERLKEIEREKEELFYKMKLETLDKIEFGDDNFGKVKRKLKKLLE